FSGSQTEADAVAVAGGYQGRALTGALPVRRLETVAVVRGLPVHHARRARRELDVAGAARHRPAPTLGGLRLVEHETEHWAPSLFRSRAVADPHPAMVPLGATTMPGVTAQAGSRRGAFLRRELDAAIAVSAGPPAPGRVAWLTVRRRLPFVTI